MLVEKPIFIVLAAPGTYGATARYRCMTCKEIYPMTSKSLHTMQDLRARKLMFVIVCYECYSIMNDQAPDRPMTLPVGMTAARQILGLDE